ncbi:MAG: histidine phosphatase family protein [Ignavibacteriales bacterium]
MRLILVRHGETIWNAEGKYQGILDIQLSDKGRREAEMAARWLENEHIDAIYSSYLSRAQETAEIIARPHNLPVQVYEDLGEINFGDWEGLTAAEIKEAFGVETYRLWEEEPEQAIISGGDRMVEFAERVNRGIDNLVEAHPDQTVVAVTHGGLLMVLGCRIGGESLSCFRKYYHNNAAISIVETEGDTLRFKVLNSQKHLEKEN